jgi:two-component system response regulator DevR
MKQIRLVIIEDSRVLREGLVALLEDSYGVKVLAAVGSSGAELVMFKMKPQLVILSQRLHRPSCMQLIIKIKKEVPEIELVVMDLIIGQKEVMEFVQAGVCGFILSTATLDDFIETVQAVARGEKVLPDPLTTSLFLQIVDNGFDGGNLPSFKESANITKREKEIIALLGKGLSNKEIAQRLNLATYTVKSHVHNILEKLALHSRLQVVAYSQSKQALDGKSPFNLA